jgi:hypothetical protein
MRRYVSFLFGLWGVMKIMRIRNARTKRLSGIGVGIGDPGWGRHARNEKVSPMDVSKGSNKHMRSCEGKPHPI